MGDKSVRVGREGGLKGREMTEHADDRPARSPIGQVSIPITRIGAMMHPYVAVAPTIRLLRFRDGNRKTLNL
jgi:hypothetical protein